MHTLPLAISDSWMRGGALVAAFFLLLVGAEIFTNGVEWLGLRLGISESATGSILAAMGTALPETTIPVIAIIEGGTAAEHVGVGAILGAPFMLATLAMFLVGASVLYFRDRRIHGANVHFAGHSTRRDLSFFLVGYTLAFAAALTPHLVSVAIAAVLILLYVAYLYFTLKAGELGDEEAMDDLHLGMFVERLLSKVGYDPEAHGENPHFVLVALQTLGALAVIVFGARLFVDEVEWLSDAVLGAPTPVVALLIAPIATELPETFNSVLWLARDKDTLALNNITGAMAFQGTLPVTLGILFTDWDLTPAWGTPGFLNAASVVLAVLAGLFVFFRARRTDDGTLEPTPFFVGGAFYLAFIALTLYFVFGTGLMAASG